MASKRERLGKRETLWGVELGGEGARHMCSIYVIFIGAKKT